MTQAEARRRWVAGLLMAWLALAGVVFGACVDRASGPADGEVGARTPAREPPPPVQWSGEGCTASGCHAGIEAIRQPGSGMLTALRERGAAYGDPDGCVVCHGGDPQATGVPAAHEGAAPSLAEEGGPEAFYPDPASPWINDRTCGQCHAELVQAQWNSLMMTEAGKIQGTTWSFGAAAGNSYEHRWANYPAANPEDPRARLGTEAYRAYMADKSAAHPDVFVAQHEGIPAAPGFDDVSAVAEDPQRAVFTYIRAECQRCHLGVKGRPRRGDFRGMGCGACHLPYGNEGRYEGSDVTVSPEELGRPLVHTIQGTRDAWVTVHETSYSGVPVETCTTCHNRGKRIGVSYQGLMESAWASPYTEGGGGQIGLHSKHYIAMEQDVHYRRGMLCQDCHTSGDVHGDRFLAGANLAAVEIECTDCHGTPTAYPWELPLGWGDEDGRGDRAEGPARGVADALPEHLRRGHVAEEGDGFILTARGNPMPEIRRVEDRVLLHTAGGRDLWLEPLKRKLEGGTLSVEARVAMVHAGKHLETMECYSCHSSWAPQCYGCHVKVDYSGGSRAFDWVAAGRKHATPEHARDRGEQGYNTWLPGEITELRSFMRWEDPPLGVNGEGRVSPLIPGCQVSVTVIGPDGEEVVRNQIFRTPAHTEGAGPEGQLGTDMSPVQPHTVGRARPCESCHGSAKAMGYGIPGPRPWDQPKVVDLATADGEILSNRARAQVEAVQGLDHEWSAVVTPEGQQLQTVGHHFEGSGPLSDEQRRRMDRHNVCVGCHQEIPEQSLAVSLLHHVAAVSGQLPEDNESHGRLLHSILLGAAWMQVGLGALAMLVLLGGVAWWRRRRAPRSATPR